MNTIHLSDLNSMKLFWCMENVLVLWSSVVCFSYHFQNVARVAVVKLSPNRVEMARGD